MARKIRHVQVLQVISAVWRKRDERGDGTKFECSQNKKVNRVEFSYIHYFDNDFSLNVFGILMSSSFNNGTGKLQLLSNQEIWPGTCCVRPLAYYFNRRIP